jgi:BirA family biotin operon repressor/biotin-[acetyl-CoA-carboxylase] ligase
MLGGKKAAGILAESTVVGETVCYAVVGIGLNVALDTSETEEISAFATSVNAAAGREMERESLLRQLLLDLDDTYIQLGRGVSPIPEWSGLLENLGTRVEVTSGSETHIGLAEGVDDGGNLLLRLDSGQVLTMTAGDVTLGSPKRS